MKCDLKTEFRCNSGHCITRSSVNDGINDCNDQSDENVKEMDCYPEELRCFFEKHAILQERNRCISTDMVRNGQKDCFSNVDEITFIKECFEDSSFLCLDQSRCLPRKYLCDGVQNCIDGSDEIEHCHHPTMYRVIKPGGRAYIATWFSLFADNMDIQHAVDFNNEEVYFEGKRQVREHMFGLKCLSKYQTLWYGYRKRTVPVHLKGSDVTYCKNEVDKCYDCTGRFNCAYCFDKTRILNSQLCDGAFDCRDLSDECLCEGSEAKALCKIFFSNDVDQTKIPSFNVVCTWK